LTPRKIQWDQFSFDKDFAVDETSEYLYVHPVSMAMEGVYPYSDGMAFKPAVELEKATNVSRMYICWDHPPANVVTRREEIKGNVDGLHFDRKNNKVKGRLAFIKSALSEDQCELIRSGARRDLSLGFYYEEDRNPGNWNGQKYDYIQKNMLFDHVASVDHGRCPFPECGIGVDSRFHPSNNFSLAGQVLIPIPYDSNGDQMSMLPGRVDPTKAHLHLAGPTDRSCGSCINYVWDKSQCLKIEGPVSAVNLCDYYQSKQTIFNASIEDDKELEYSERKRLPNSSFAYISPKGERKLPLDTRGRVIAALNAIQNWSYRGNRLDIPTSAKASMKRKACAAARKFGVKSAFCGTSEDAASLMKQLLAMDRDKLVKFHTAIHRADDFCPDGTLHKIVLFALKKKQ